MELSNGIWNRRIKSLRFVARWITPTQPSRHELTLIGYAETIQNASGAVVGNYPLSLNSPPGPQGRAGIRCGTGDCITGVPAATQSFARPSGPTSFSTPLDLEYFRRRLSKRALMGLHLDGRERVWSRTFSSRSQQRQHLHLDRPPLSYLQLLDFRSAWQFQHLSFRAHASFEWVLLRFLLLQIFPERRSRCRVQQMQQIPFLSR